MTVIGYTSPIEYLKVYQQAVEHQRSHGPGTLADWPGEPPKPSRMCTQCLIYNKTGDGRPGPGPVGDGAFFDLPKEYSWAVPTEKALATIARYSPRGVVEIGAGGGYWAMLLRQRGVDVVAYDPDLTGAGKWHLGQLWSEVLLGDHTSVVKHPDRTLLLCWPCYDAPWTGETVDLYGGDTVIYIGEGSGGCTGDERMHALLGDSSCWHSEQHDQPEARFAEVERVALPQWMGLHDDLYVYARLGQT